VVTLGRPEVWPAAVALENQVGQQWVPPLGDADFWLLRLACTLRQPGGSSPLVRSAIKEAQQTLALRPRNGRAARDTTYAFSLFPDRLTAEDKVELSAGLEPGLKFAKTFELKVGKLGAKIEFRKVFPVIQAYGAGEPEPYWVFKPHAAHPLEGSQFVYAVVAAGRGADGVLGHVDMTVTVEDRLFGLIRYGLPDEAAQASFAIL
jgi:hypothetical protein